MRLYHGSNVEVRSPGLLPTVRALDFGSGFYLTSDLEQAQRWSVLTVRRRGVGSPRVSVFEIENFEGLTVLKFDKPDAEWLRFVSANRNSRQIENSRDVVIGPIANDNTMPVLNLYLKGSYDEAEAIKRLLPQKLKDQYVFKTDQAISALKYVEVVSV